MRIPRRLPRRPTYVGNSRHVNNIRHVAATPTALVAARTDPVRHVASLGIAYVENAVAHPDLFRVMFDGTIELDDHSVADQSFGLLVAAAGRAIDTGRFTSRNQPADVALHFWASGHGLVVLGISGILPIESLPRLASNLATAVFVHAGDDPQRAKRSVAAAWRATKLTPEFATPPTFPVTARDGPSASTPQPLRHS